MYMYAVCEEDSSDVNSECALCMYTVYNDVCALYIRVRVIYVKCVAYVYCVQ
jgi:hypothetical protein